MPDKIYLVRYYTLAGPIEQLIRTLGSATELCDWHASGANPFRQHPDFKQPELFELSVSATEQLR